MSQLSTFLFARPAMSEGVGRLVDFAGLLNEYNVSATGEQADELALWADWTVVGNDLRSSFANHLMDKNLNVPTVESVEQQP